MLFCDGQGGIFRPLLFLAKELRLMLEKYLLLSTGLLLHLLRSYEVFLAYQDITENLSEIMQ